MKGRRPQPDALKTAKGNPGRRPIKIRDGKSSLADYAGASAPSWLSEEGFKIWERLAPDLSRMHLLGKPDASTFGRYCENFARWLKMQAALDVGSETYTVETASGIVHRARPEFMIADRLERQLLAAEDRFGLNPANRQRIFAIRASGAGAGDQQPLFPDGAAEPINEDPETLVAGPIGLLN